MPSSGLQEHTGLHTHISKHIYTHRETTRTIHPRPERRRRFLIDELFFFPCDAVTQNLALNNLGECSTTELPSDLCSLKQGFSKLFRKALNSLCSLGKPSIFHPPASVTEIIVLYYQEGLLFMITCT